MTIKIEYSEFIYWCLDTLTTEFCKKNNIDLSFENINRKYFLEELYLKYNKKNK